MIEVATCLWFQERMEEAVEYYTSLIPDSRIVDVMRAPEGAPFPEGAAISMTFELGGRRFVAVAGAPTGFNDAVSIFLVCKTQEEIDRLWEELLAGGGQEKMCGWLTDRFGLTWQVVPERLQAFLQDSDPARAGRTMAAMLGMVKLDIAQLEAAYEGRET